MEKKIFITKKIPPIAKEILSKHFQVDENNSTRTLSREELIDAISSYDGVLSTIPDKIDKSVLEHAKGLSAIANYAISLDNIDLAFAKERGIAVYNTPDVVTNSTADLAFAIFLSYIRKFPEAQAFVKQDKWKGWEPDLYLGEELTGKIFGIIGFGRIGRAITERALGFGLKVVVYHRSPIKGSHERITQISWEEFLNTVDYFSINVPMNDETHHLIDYQVMKQMKKKASTHEYGKRADCEY